MVVGGSRISNKWCRENNIHMEKRETKFRAVLHKVGLVLKQSAK